MKKIISIIATVVATSFIMPVAHADMFSVTEQSHNLIGLSEAHKLGFDGKGQYVVVIDTGVLSNHEYLRGTIADGFCASEYACGINVGKSGIAFGEVTKDPVSGRMDDHGSMVAGVIAGQRNAFAPGGIAPKAKIISINNTNGNEAGIIRGLEWVLSIKSKYNIVAVSASFGTPGPGDRNGESSCSISNRIESAIDKLYSSGIAFVAASGNSGGYSNVDFPACLSKVFAVGAVNSTGQITSYSNIGKQISSLAPADIVTASANGGYWTGAGTSTSAPVVAGAIAILKQANPKSSLEDIRKALASTNTYKDDQIWGNLPVLNIPIALKSIMGETVQFKTVSRVNQSTVAINTSSDNTSKLNDQISALTAKINELQNEIIKNNSTVNSLNKKLAKVCSVKPKPKYC